MEDIDIFPELLDKIFSFLEYKDLRNASQVDSTWHSIATRSLKRRLFLQLHDICRGDETYVLKFRKHEPIGPSMLIDVNQDNHRIKASDLEALKFDGGLFSPFSSAANLPLLAILLMPDSWGLKIRRLDFGFFYDSDKEDSDYYFKFVAAQDWNVAGTHVLSKFPSLESLSMSLGWIQGYVSMLQVPVVPEATFESIQFIFITLVKLQDCQDWNFQFTTSCSNLKEFRLHGHSETSYQSQIFRSSYWILKGDLTLKICSAANPFPPSVWKALLPVLEATLLTSLALDCSTLQLIQAPVAGKIKSLCVTFNSNSFEVLDEDVDYVLAAVHKGGFSGLEDLKLRWTENEVRESSAFEKNADTGDLYLPSVKRLQLSGIDVGSQDADLRPCHKRLIKALPNLEMLVVCYDCKHWWHYRSSMPNNPIHSTRFLEYTSELKKLRHLVWDEGFCRKNLTELRRLEEVTDYLARHQALESLTIPSGLTYAAQEAIAETCAAMPRMRLLQVHTQREVDQSVEFKRLKSKYNTICIQSMYTYQPWDCNDFQIDHLDKLCVESEPPDGVSEPGEASEEFVEEECDFYILFMNSDESNTAR